MRASMGFEPVTSAIPVRCSTNWAMKPHIYCDDQSSLSFTTALQIWIVSYKLHIISLHEKILASLPMCVFIAQLVEHRTSIAEVTRSNPVEAPRPWGIAALQSWLVPAASTRICSSTCYMWEASLLPLARMFSSSKKTVRPNALERSAEGFWTSSSRPAYGQTSGSRPWESERWSVIRHLRCRQPKSA